MESKEKEYNSLSCLSNKETRLRSLFKSYLIIKLVFFSFCVLIAYWNKTSAQLCFSAILIPTIAIALLILNFYITYYCTYKKNGTLLLAFDMILFSPYYIIMSAVQASTSGNSTSVIGFLMTCVLIIPFYFLGLKMRTINKKIQTFAFLSSNDYEKAVDSMRSAQNLDDLKFKFHAAFQECPGRFSNALSPVYEEMKKKFLKQ